MSEKHHKGKTEEEIDDQTEDYKNIQYRMYEKKFPDVDDLVMCKIIEIFNDGAYVILEEYNNIKGLLLCTEISRKRVNYVTRLIKEGKEEVLRVKTIDKEKGFIDLSKKSVKAEEVEQFKEKLFEWFGLEVIMQDERLTTKEATNYLLEADMSRKKRKKKIDALAANIILQTYLDKRKD